MSADTSFLMLENPNFDLGSLVPKKKEKPGLLFTSIREMLIDQPPMSDREVIPTRVKILEGEVALSSRPFDNSFHMEPIGLYVNKKHRIIAELAVKEIATTEYPETHGTLDTFKEGCRGPLCRRANREDRAIRQQIRQARLDYQTKEDKPTYLMRPERRKDRVLRAAPHYASIDPLMVAVTVYAHKLIRPTRPDAMSKVWLSLDTNQKLCEYLMQEYPTFVK